MRKPTLLVLMALVVFCSFASCSNSVPDPTLPPPTPEPTPTPTPTPEPTPTIVYLTFEVANNAAPYAIDELQIFPSADDWWGDDLLGGSPLGNGRNKNSVELTLVSDSWSENIYGIRLLDDDGDEFFFYDAALGDCARMVISWDFTIRRYIADLYDEEETLYATLESVSSEANTFETVVPLHARIDAEAVLSELEMAVHYPSKAFHVLEVDESFVHLVSNDGKAILEVTSNEPWNAPDRVYYSTQKTRYENVVRPFVNDKLKAVGATDIKWQKMDIEDSRYEGIWQIIYMYGHVDYLQDDVPMHTVCRIEQYRRSSDWTLFLYTLTLSVPIDDFEFYWENYFFKIMLIDYIGDGIGNDIGDN